MELKKINLLEIENKKKEFENRIKLKKLNVEIINGIKEIGKVKFENNSKKIIKQKIKEIIIKNGYSIDYIKYVDETSLGDLLTNEIYHYIVIVYKVKEFEFEEKIDLMVGWDSEITENERYCNGLNIFNRDLLKEIEGIEKRRLNLYDEISNEIEEYNENIQKILNFNFKYGDILF